MNDVFVSFGQALDVVHVPAQGFEEGVEKFAAELGFVVLPGFIGIEMLLELIDQPEDLFRCAHERDSGLFLAPPENNLAIK